MLDLPFSPYTFDIETLDLAGSAEVIGWCLYDVQHDVHFQAFRCIKVGADYPSAWISEAGIIRELSDYLQDLRHDYKESLRLVTYNGENYRGGFDFPFLRRRYIENKLQDRWPFKGLRHLDMLPLVQTRLNTSYRMPVSIDILNAGQCSELCGLINLKPQKTMAANLEQIDAACLDVQSLGIVNNYLSRFEPPLKTDNKLDAVYDLLHGPDLGVVGIDGSKVPGMWKQYLESGDEQIRRDLMRYNLSDCQQTAYVFKELYPLLGEDVERDWRRL